MKIDADNRNMALALQENIIRTMSQADTVLQFMKTEWENHGVIDPMHLNTLRNILAGGVINQIGVADEAGNLIFSAVPLTEPLNIAAREHFQAHVAQDTKTMYLAAPSINRVTGSPTLFLSRRLNGPDGQFKGIVSVGLEQKYILQVFRDMELGDSNSLSLLRTDGSLLARAPGGFNEVEFATFFKRHPSLPYVRQGISVGVYEVPGVDGIPRFGAFRLFPNYPVVALVTTKQDAALKDVRYRQTLYRYGALTFSSVVVLSFLIIWLQMRRQYNTENMLRTRERDLAYAGYHDQLTGIFNRAYFYDVLKKIDSHDMSEAAFILGDLDGLKVINDTFGHEMGDKTLCIAAEILTKSIPSDATVARIGGDEFAIFLPKATKQEVDAICNSIRHRVKCYNKGTPNQVLPLQISLGVSLGEYNKYSPEEMLAIADKLMYREKLQQASSRRSQLTTTLKEMLAARDFITEGHAVRVQEMAIALAGAAGVEPEKIADLELFAHFHDIGKVGISDTILNKPGPLTYDERRDMEQHSEIGHRIARATEDLAPIADWILKHHERWDGHGYPLGIKGTDIPVECRILAIVDAYDAMTSDRPYRKAMSAAEALAEIRRNAGSQFDPDLVREFEMLQSEKNELA